MMILGISAFYHDSAAALVRDGRIIAAAQEERFTRKRHDANFPKNAIRYCLSAGGIGIDDISQIVFYEKPFPKFERLIETYLAFAPRGLKSFMTSMPVWLGEKLLQKKRLIEELNQLGGRDDLEDRLLFSEHHFSHAASAFFASPFADAAILTMDGVGEWATTSAAFGSGNEIQIHKELHFPHSIGLLYSAFTYYTGFKVNSGEYKVMGLAPYGTPRYADAILDRIIDLKPDGSLWLDQQYFDYCTGLTMTNDRFHDLFGGPPRKPNESLTQRHMDLAASVQAVTDEIVLRLTRQLAADTGARNLCLAGGVALNCVANGKVLRDGRFKGLWAQPAAGDAGGAIGAALAGYHSFGGKDRVIRTPDLMDGAFLGPEFSDAQAARRLYAAGANFVQLKEGETISRAASDLVEGKAVGWFQGRMEFGPRALGNRSILADARSPQMQSLLNQKIKYRESFRPFAPAVLREDVAEWFELDMDSPYMLFVAPVHPKRCRPVDAADGEVAGLAKLKVHRSDIPAVTHIDSSARIQTVHRETNPRFHALLSQFKSHTGCGVLVNTSFNVRGEPIVCTPDDAFRCFMGTELDTLYVGNLMMEKTAQNAALKHAHQESFELD